MDVVEDRPFCGQKFEPTPARQLENKYRSVISEPLFFHPYEHGAIPLITINIITGKVLLAL